MGLLTHSEHADEATAKAGQPLPHARKHAGLLTEGITINNNNNKAKPTKPAPSSYHWRLLTRSGRLPGAGAVLGAG